jgi:hypothetical protein
MEEDARPTPFLGDTLSLPVVDAGAATLPHSINLLDDSENGAPESFDTMTFAVHRRDDVADVADDDDDGENMTSSLIFDPSSTAQSTSGVSTASLPGSLRLTPREKLSQLTAEVLRRRSVVSDAERVSECTGMAETPTLSLEGRDCASLCETAEAIIGDWEALSQRLDELAAALRNHALSDFLTFSLQGMKAWKAKEGSAATLLGFLRTQRRALASAIHNRFFMGVAAPQDRLTVLDEVGFAFFFPRAYRIYQFGTLCSEVLTLSHKSHCTTWWFCTVHGSDRVSPRVRAHAAGPLGFRSVEFNAWTSGYCRHCQHAK